MTIQRLSLLRRLSLLDAKTIKDENIRRIYVCSPLSASTPAGIMANMLVARDKVNVLNGLYSSIGCKAWAPHAYLPAMLDDSNREERELALEFGLKLLEMSDAIYVFGEKVSFGMCGEIRSAARRRIPIFISDNLFDEVSAVIDKETCRMTEEEARFNV